MASFRKTGVSFYFILFLFLFSDAFEHNARVFCVENNVWLLSRSYRCQYQQISTNVITSCVVIVAVFLDGGNSPCKFFSQVNKPLKSSYINGYMNDTKFRSRSGMIIPNRVFVGGICPTATENDLLNLFAKYGAVKAVKIISDQNGSSKGYGFVTYEKPDDVTRLQNDVSIFQKPPEYFELKF